MHDSFIFSCFVHFLNDYSHSLLMHSPFILSLSITSNVFASHFSLLTGKSARSLSLREPSCVTSVKDEDHLRTYRPTRCPELFWCGTVDLGSFLCALRVGQTHACFSPSVEADYLRTDLRLALNK